MRKKTAGKLWCLITALVLFAAGCATQAAVIPEADDTAHATPKGTGWIVELSGVRADELWESNFEKWKEDPASGYGDYVFKFKGKDESFGAMPLKNIIAMVDDPDASMPYSFQQQRWNEGYDLTLEAADGYSITINTADFDPDSLYLADMRNGEKISPMLTGTVSSQYWVRDLASISASLEALSLAENSFELLIEINGKNGAYTIKELENLPYYIEDKGNYTNSYDNNFQFVWGGVKIVDLINEYGTLKKDMTVTIEAMDGYAMSYSGSQLLDNADGDWILAFKENGEYMPEDPGYIRLVKVGPENPTITGHTSARMVKKIIIEQKEFKDFEISLVQNGKIEKMDRQTLQSGVTTWKSKVNYFNRKSSSETTYIGIPVHAMLERYTGYSSVIIEAADGFRVTMPADQIAGNDNVILGMFYGDGTDLNESEFPLILVWDKNASVVPDGIKAVKNVTKVIVE